MNTRGISNLHNALHAMYVGASFRAIRFPSGFNHSKIYSHSLVPIKTGDSVIMPMAVGYTNYINSFMDKKEEKLVFPLVPCRLSNHNCIRRKSADSLIGYLLLGQHYNTETIRVVSNYSGEIYYGSSGFILDKDFNPLVVFACEVKYDDHDYWILARPVCIINPEVFKRSDNVSKYIVSKLIPYLSEYKCSEVYTDPSIKLVISHDISNFIEKPAQPVANLYEELWKCAEENIDEMLE